MIWIVGKDGMLGSDVVEQIEAAGLEYCASDIDVDITDRRAIQEFVQDKTIDWIVNCAAYTAVDRAEEDREASERLNIRGPGYLAAAAASIGARIIHISTDYVFGSMGERIEPLRPLTEIDSPSPASVYGRTKLLGEQAVDEQTSRYFIIRIAWLYGRWGKNFVFTMLRLLEEKPQLKVKGGRRPGGLSYLEPGGGQVDPQNYRQRLYRLRNLPLLRPRSGKLVRLYPADRRVCPAAGPGAGPGPGGAVQQCGVSYQGQTASLVAYVHREGGSHLRAHHNPQVSCMQNS
jgi:hypothetical protein